MAYETLHKLLDVVNSINRVVDTYMKLNVAKKVFEGCDVDLKLLFHRVRYLALTSRGLGANSRFIASFTYSATQVNRNVEAITRVGLGVCTLSTCSYLEVFRGCTWLAYGKTVCEDRVYLLEFDFGITLTLTDGLTFMSSIHDVYDITQRMGKARDRQIVESGSCETRSEGSRGTLSDYLSKIFEELAKEMFKKFKVYVKVEEILRHVDHEKLEQTLSEVGVQCVDDVVKVMRLTALTGLEIVDTLDLDVVHLSDYVVEESDLSSCVAVFKNLNDVVKLLTRSDAKLYTTSSVAILIKQFKPNSVVYTTYTTTNIKDLEREIANTLTKIKLLK